MARRVFLERLSRTLITVTLLTSSSAVGAVAAKLGDTWVLGLTAAAAATSAILVVWRLVDTARDHALMVERFYRTAQAINVEVADERRVLEWRNEVFRAYGDTTAVYHALNAECYNAATLAISATPHKLIRLRWWQRAIRNWWRFSPATFQLRDNPALER